MDDETTELYLIRHGESVPNVTPVIGGMRGDTGLTDRGRDQARLLEKRLRDQEVRADQLYASTLPRAWETAEYVSRALDLPVQPDDEPVAQQQEQPPAELDAPSPVPEIAATVLPSVARVDVGQGSGSAVIYSADGYLVTNNHVVAGGGQGQTGQSGAAGNIQVILADGVRRDAEVVGTAPDADLAVRLTGDRGCR